MYICLCVWLLVVFCCVRACVCVAAAVLVFVGGDCLFVLSACLFACLFILLFLFLLLVVFVSALALI